MKDIPAHDIRARRNQKTIKSLIAELQSFENQDLPVRISVDDGDHLFPISFVQKEGNAVYLLVFCPDW